MGQGGLCVNNKNVKEGAFLLFLLVNLHLDKFIVYDIVLLEGKKYETTCIYYE